MPEPLCICCYDPVTTENGDPLYLEAATAGVADVSPAAWVHRHCLADHAMPFQIADFPESDLEALREFARKSAR